MSVSGSDRFDSLNRQGVYGEITVGTTPVEVKVGASPLAHRGLVHILAKDNQIYWGYDNSVTTTTGTRIFRNQLVFLPVGPDVSIWLVANGAGRDAAIGELA